MFKHEPIEFNYTLTCNDGETHRTYTVPNGNKYPSITTVLSILSRDSIDAWKKRVGTDEAAKISNRASNRGTKIHQILENYLNNEPTGIARTDIMSQQAFNKMQKLLDSHIDTVYAQEVPLYSDKFKIAGRVDCIGQWDGELAIIDFKTSAKLKRKEWIESYFMQCAFYAAALYEQTGLVARKVVIPISVDEHDPQVFIENSFDWLPKLNETRQKFFDEFGV